MCRGKRGVAAGRSAERGTSGATTGGGGRSAPDPEYVLAATDRELLELEPTRRPAVLELSKALLPIGIGNCVHGATGCFGGLAAHHFIGLVRALLRLLPQQKKNRGDGGAQADR